MKMAGSWRGMAYWHLMPTMEKFSKLPDDDYSVRIIAMMNNYEFKIVQFNGT